MCYLCYRKLLDILREIEITCKMVIITQVQNKVSNRVKYP